MCLACRDAVVLELQEHALRRLLSSLLRGARVPVGNRSMSLAPIPMAAATRTAATRTAATRTAATTGTGLQRPSPRLAMVGRRQQPRLLLSRLPLLPRQPLPRMTCGYQQVLYVPAPSPPLHARTRGGEGGRWRREGLTSKLLALPCTGLTSPAARAACWCRGHLERTCVIAAPCYD